MNKLLTLNKDYDIKLKSKITKFSTPKYVYLPIKNGEEMINHLEVKKEEKISKFSISPISGKIMGIKYCSTIEEGMVKCLAILNNYKETFYKRSASLKDLEKISLEKCLIDLIESDHNSLANKIKETPKQATLLILGLEDEPYEANEIFTLKEYANEVLEMIDVLREKLVSKETKIILKNNDRDNIEQLEDLLGTYTNIELNVVPDYYLLGTSEMIKEYLNIKHNSLILKASEIKIIYDVLKRRRKYTEHLFTISGNGITNPQMIEAKIGTSVKEIMNQYIKIKKNRKLEYIVNGLMTGKKIELDNLIVTKELKSILIMKEDQIAEKECINCGKCISICPKFCNPRKCLDSKEKKYRQNCIDCGLCSYICPAYINLRKYLKGDPHE